MNTLNVEFVRSFAPLLPAQPLVYALWSPEGERVYIGYSSHIADRLNHHASMSPWWHRVSDVSWVLAPTEQRARRLETRAIWRCRPPMNLRVDRPRGLGKRVRVCRHSGLPYLGLKSAA